MHLLSTNLHVLQREKGREGGSRLSQISENHLEGLTDRETTVFQSQTVCDVLRLFSRLVEFRGVVLPVGSRIPRPVQSCIICLPSMFDV